jgi:hypothetical protein
VPDQSDRIVFVLRFGTRGKVKTFPVCFQNLLQNHSAERKTVTGSGNQYNCRETPKSRSVQRLRGGVAPSKQLMVQLDRKHDSSLAVQHQKPALRSGAVPASGLIREQGRRETVWRTSIGLRHSDIAKTQFESG